jgi:hypothetical protein
MPGYVGGGVDAIGAFEAGTFTGERVGATGALVGALTGVDGPAIENVTETSGKGVPAWFF